MTLNELHQLVAKGESDTLEFKKSTAELDTAFETICGFLNHKGGTVLIGVGNNGTIIGQDVSDNTQKKIATCVKNIDPPAYMYVDTKYIKLENNKTVIAITAKNNGYSPYTYEAKPYIRNQTTTLPMPQHHYQELMIRRSQLNHSWERIVEANYSIDDLDTQLINKIIKIAINKGRLEENADNFSIDHLLDKLKLIENGKLTRAAIVLFCKDERKQFIQSQVRLARFRGIDKNEFIDSKLYNGNIFYLYEKAMNFLNNYLPISGKIVEGEAARRDVPAIPLIVLREALINALIHRDYNIAGGAVSVAIYDDRVEVVNVGSLLAGLSVEKLTKPHSSVLRNPTIANVLYISGYIEMWGRGTTNIVNFSKEAGNPEPEFTATDIDFTVCLPLKESIGHETKTNYYQELNPRQQEILTLLSNGKVIKSAEILKMLSTHPSIRTIKADLLKLQQDGLIEKIGGGRSTAWKLKKA